MPDELLERGGPVNDWFHVLTWRSPLRSPKIRKIVRIAADVMLASGDPGVSAVGLATDALLDQFEKRG